MLELLAAVCLVRGGHEIILSAFDHFKTVINWVTSLYVQHRCEGPRWVTDVSRVLQVCSESMRFEKLMEHFKNEDDNIDFLVCGFRPPFKVRVLMPSVTTCACYQVACMQFINIVVHSVEDMNFRVHLQYDFTKLNLEEHLEVNSNSTVLLLVISGFPGVELVFYRLNGSKQLTQGPDRSH